MEIQGIGKISQPFNLSAILTLFKYQDIICPTTLIKYYESWTQ